MDIDYYALSKHSPIFVICHYPPFGGESLKPWCSCSMKSFTYILCSLRKTVWDHWRPRKSLSAPVTKQKKLILKKSHLKRTVQVSQRSDQCYTPAQLLLERTSFPQGMEYCAFLCTYSQSETCTGTTAKQMWSGDKYNFIDIKFTSLWRMQVRHLNQ